MMAVEGATVVVRYAHERSKSFHQKANSPWTAQPFFFRLAISRGIDRLVLPF